MQNMKLTSQTFGDVLDELILYSGKNVNALARATGLHRETIVGWRNGKNGPTLYALDMLLGALGKELIVRDKR